MFRSKDHPQRATLSLLKSLLKLVTDCFCHIILVVWQHVLLCKGTLLRVADCGCASCALLREYHAAKQDDPWIETCRNNFSV